MEFRQLYQKIQPIQKNSTFILLNNLTEKSPNAQFMSLHQIIVKLQIRHVALSINFPPELRLLHLQHQILLIFLLQHQILLSLHLYHTTPLNKRLFYGLTMFFSNFHSNNFRVLQELKVVLTIVNSYSYMTFNTISKLFSYPVLY